jgi:hypothetical protein
VVIGLECENPEQRGWAEAIPLSVLVEVLTQCIRRCRLQDTTNDGTSRFLHPANQRLSRNGVSRAENVEVKRFDVFQEAGQELVGDRIAGNRRLQTSGRRTSSRVLLAEDVIRIRGGMKSLMLDVHWLPPWQEAQPAALNHPLPAATSS